MLNGKNSIKNPLHKVFLSENLQGSSLACYEQLIKQKPIVIITKLPDIILLNKSINIEFDSDSTCSSFNDSESELSNDNKDFFADKKNVAHYSFTETLYKNRSNSSLEQSYLKPDQDSKENKHKSEFDIKPVYLKNSIKDEISENEETLTSRTIRDTFNESDKNNVLSEKQLVNDFLYSQISFEHVTNDFTDQNEDTISLDADGFIERFKDKPKLTKFNESDDECLSMSKKGNLEFPVLERQNNEVTVNNSKRKCKNLLSRKTKYNNKTKNENINSMEKPPKLEKNFMNVSWQSEKGLQENGDSSNYKISRIKNEKNHISTENDSSDIKMPTLINMVDNVQSFEAESTKDCQLKDNSIKKSLNNKALDFENKTKMEDELQPHDQYSDLDGELLIDESENCESKINEDENRIVDEEICHSELCVQNIKTNENKRKHDYENSKIKKQKLYNVSSNNDIKWNKKLTAAEIKLLSLLPQSKNNRLLSIEASKQINDNDNDNLYLTEKFKPGRIVNKQRPKHWISFKLHLQRQKFLRGVGKQPSGPRKRIKDLVEEGGRNKNHKEDSCNPEVKQMSRNSESTTDDYENRLSKEFPKHNWLPHKLQQNGYLEQTNTNEKNNVGECKQHTDNLKLNSNHSCDTKLSLNEDNCNSIKNEKRNRSLSTKFHSCKNGHNKIKLPDNLRKCLKLCSYCMISCCQEKRESDSPSTSLDAEEKAKTTNNTNNEACKEIKDSPENQTNRKIGICLTNKPSYTPTVMVSPQRKPCINQEQKEETTAVNMTDELHGEVLQNAFSSKMNKVPNAWKSNAESNNPKFIIPQQNWKPSEENKSNVEKVDIFPHKSSQGDGQFLTEINPNSSIQESHQHESNNNFVYNNACKKTLIENQMPTNSHFCLSQINEKSLPLVSNGVKLNENTIMPLLAIQDASKIPNLTSPIKIMKYQNDYNTNKPPPEPHQKPYSMNLQDLSHQPTFNPHERTSSHSLLLESRQNMMSYAQRKKMIKVELDCKTRELQQIEYIMAQKERECKELMQLKQSKSELLLRIKHEQDLLEHQQYHMQINLQDSANLNSTPINQNTIPERDRILIQSKPTDTILAQQYAPEIWNLLQEKSGNNPKQMWNTNDSFISKGFSASAPYSNNIRKPILFEIPSNNGSALKNIQYRSETIPQGLNCSFQSMRNNGVQPQSINRSNNGNQLMQLLYQASNVNNSIEQARKNAEVECRKIHMPIKETISSMPFSNNHDLTMDNVNLVKHLNNHEKQFNLHTNLPQVLPQHINLRKDIGKNISLQRDQTSMKEFQHAYVNCDDKRIETSKENVQIKNDKGFENLQTLIQKQKAEFQNYPITSQLLINHQFSGQKSNSVAKSLTPNELELSQKVEPPCTKGQNYKNSHENRMKSITDRVSSTDQETNYQSQTETIIIEDDDMPSEILDSYDRCSQKCKHCQIQASLLCSGCKKEWYCSPKCQIAEWSQHSLVCRG